MDPQTVAGLAQGRSAVEIAATVRELVDRGDVAAGERLPTVRALADALDVNRNTVVAAYGQLAHAGLVEGRGRAGTVVVGPRRVAEEGWAPGTALVDLGAGNPDPALLPDLTAALAGVGGRPVMYGDDVLDPGLARVAEDWLGPDVGAAGEHALSVTSGAFDAVERLLDQALTRDDAVGVEDPCHLAVLRTVRLDGYRSVPIPVDEEGMTVEGVRAALAQGVRAIVCTPRAQNPTGASLGAERAARLREVLADHPYVLLVLDDHYSLLARTPMRTIVGPDHRRWALVRSVSKFLGPDMSLALVATDLETAERLARRLSPGTTWVSHLLQRLTCALLTDPAARATIESAGEHYADRNAAFRELLERHGRHVPVGEGLTLWVPTLDGAAAVADRLRGRGWLVRAGDEFAVDAAAASHYLRVTVHHLDAAAAGRFVEDLVAVDPS